jgi:hypothetical protein
MPPPGADDKKPQDYAEILKKNFATITDPKAKPRFTLSERNRIKLERIRQKVGELRGNS